MRQEKKKEKKRELKKTKRLVLFFLIAVCRLVNHAAI